MIHVENNVSLRNFHTFRIDSQCKHYCCVKTEDDIIDVIHQTDENIFILGNGSNTIFCNDFHGLIIHNKINGIEVLKETANDITLKVGAGEQWSGFVDWCICNNYFGIENLVMIPGTIGGAIVQNIGAYGVEVSNVVDGVNVIDNKTFKSLYISNDECRFSYRDSIFKCSNYVITNVVFVLSKKERPNIRYKSLNDAIKSSGCNVTAKDVSNVIKQLRSQHIPDPNIVYNSGSFFKNVIISKESCYKLFAKYPDIKAYDNGDGLVKISTGQLIELCGLRGFEKNNIRIHDGNAMILTNNGKATGKDLTDMFDYIRGKVYNKFGITIEPEVLMI